MFVVYFTKNGVKAMNRYLLRQLNDTDYYLLCMDYTSILNYLDLIEDEPLIQSNAGQLIIDQLLVAGNGKTRFLTCQFANGEVKLGTAKNIEGSEVFKRMSSDIFRKNLDVLKYSILTDSQLDLIKQGYSI